MDIFGFIARGGIYAPDEYKPQRNEIPAAELTERQARELGYAFRRKSKSVRITGYHGNARCVTVPAGIGGLPVNEIGRRAFAESAVESVMIPDRVRRLGESAFEKSRVRRAVFGEGVRDIPKKAFYRCSELEEVLLPSTLNGIGESAFSLCGKLGYIALPNTLCRLGKSCFCGSGLNGFAARFYDSLLLDGSVFANTPLHRGYKAVLVRRPRDRWSCVVTNVDAKVLLVGKNAKVKFTGSVSFAENSICGDCEADLSGCGAVWLDRAVASDTYPHKYVKIILPRKLMGIALPYTVNAVYPDGQPYTGFLETLEDDNNGRARMRIHGRFVPTNAISTRARELILEVSAANFHNGSIKGERLQRLELTGYFLVHGEMFARECRSLREVRWTVGKDSPRAAYIPPSELVGEDVHRELLAAFQTSVEPRFRHYKLFRHEVMDELFRNGYDDRYRHGKKRRLPQRAKILAALDVLRGSPELYDSDVSLYLNYLRTHRRYAEIVCGKIAGRFPEYKAALEGLFLGDGGK